MSSVKPLPAHMLLMRHGDYDLVGGKDCLTDKGKSQAAFMAAWLKGKGFKRIAIINSQAVRAELTAIEMHEALGSVVSSRFTCCIDDVTARDKAAQIVESIVTDHEMWRKYSEREDDGVPREEYCVVAVLHLGQSECVLRTLSEKLGQPLNEEVAENMVLFCGNGIHFDSTDVASPCWTLITSDSGEG